MKRETSTNPVSRWKQAFSPGKTGGKTAELPPKKDGPATAGTSLAFIRKTPIAFQIRRAENPDEFERALFVCKARSVNAKHPFTSVVHVEWTRTGTRLVASDGQRLHVAGSEAEADDEGEAGDKEGGNEMPLL